MEKLIITFSISIIAGIILCLFMIAFHIRLGNAIITGLFLSDIILFGVYITDIINNINSDDTFFVLIYLLVSLVVYGIYIPFAYINYTSDRCICRCCRKNNYDQLV